VTARLDEVIAQIESMNSDETSGSIDELLTALNEAARVPGGPQLLVSRFSRSLNPILVRSLSFVLSRYSAPQGSENLDALLDLARDIVIDDQSALLNILTGLKRNRSNPAAGETLRVRRSSLERLILTSVDHSSTLVKTSVLHYLEQLNEDGQMYAVLSKASLVHVIGKLNDWRGSADKDLAEDARALLATIARS
jgi:hypothetical protein